MILSSERRATGEVVSTGPGIPYNTFIGVQWAGAAFSVTFVAIRLASRWYGQRRIFWDDCFAVIAAALILITASVWQWAARDMYYVLDLKAGLVPPKADFSASLMHEMKASFISQIFFYTALFSVKLSFLMFFQRLGSNVRGQVYLRWPAFILSAICFIVSVGDMGFHCLINSDVTYLSTYCVSQEFSTKMTNAVIANCVLDIVSDIAITIIPFTLLWNVRIDARKKMAFLGLFSLTLITIAAAMARAIETDVTKKENGPHDPSYVWMWGTIQASLAIVISCLSAFPQLFTAPARRVKAQWTPSDTYHQRMRSRLQRRQAKPMDPLYDMSAVTFRDHDQKNASYESRCPVLGQEMGQIDAQYGAVTYPSAILQNQTMQQFEDRVDIANQPETYRHGQSGPMYHWPMIGQHLAEAPMPPPTR